MQLPGDPHPYQKPDPTRVYKERLQDPSKHRPDERAPDIIGCKEECKRRFPMYYKNNYQAELYAECIRNCEASGNPDNPEPWKKKPKVIACINGICVEKNTATQANIDACKGKAVGDPCSKAPVEDGNGGGGGNGGEGGGEFQWSPETQALLQRILDRANMLLDQPLGLTEEERQAIYNRIFEKIKGMERPLIQSEMDRISRMGLLGSPFEERSIAGIKRGTAESLATAERDIEIEEAQRRFNQLMATTGMAQSLLGSGLGAEQTAELLSSGRRGEGRDWMQMLLNYFSTIYGGQSNAYWQAILNQLLRQYE